MPQLPLASALLHSLPWLSTGGRAAINLLVCDNGRVASARTLAARLGLRNRYQLARLLRREGLPTYDLLTGWISSLYWRVEAERTDATLLALAQRCHVAPATSYRIVRRVTGSLWSELRRTPTDEVLRRFVALCGPRHDRPGRVRPEWRPPQPANVQQLRRNDAPGATVRLELPGAPFSVALHGTREVYVARAHAAAIERLDLVSRRFVGTIPVGCVPSSVTIDAARARGYASLQYEDAIAVLDCVSHAVIARLAIAGDPFPILLDHDGTRLYVATNEDRLYALSLPSGRVAASLPLPATSHFLALHRAGHRLYVATRAGGTVLEVDTRRFCVSRILALGGEPLDLTVTADGAFLYVVNGPQGLNVVRLADGRLVRTVKFEGRPVHLAVSPDERTFYVSLVERGAVAVVDRASLAVRAFPTGGRPRGLAVTRDGRTLIVANEAGWVDMIPV